ncbi:hypothetical protein V5799_023356 [Amblyomma americanum]|uniref:Kelch-like protein diablo n=1 Tax=Amblyomma americanum TaxID=6943 RepID=A0AAQ4FJK0_AMBAM
MTMVPPLCSAQRGRSQGARREGPCRCCPFRGRLRRPPDPTPLGAWTTSAADASRQHGSEMGNSSDTADEWLNREAMDTLWNMRNSGLLCDGLLKTSDGGHFPVHKVVMASCSEYFRALFSSRLNRQNQSEVVVYGVSSEALATVVEFAYKRITWVGCENVERLLKAADYLCVLGMLKDCCDFLLSIISPENCISIHSVAKLYNCFDLTDKAYRYLMEHFVEVAKRSEEFLQLDVDDVEAVLSDENLNVVKEESVWKAALRWIEHEPDSRAHHVARLLKCVRTGLVDTNYFVEKIKTNKYVADSEACRPLVIDTLRFLYDLDVVVHNDEVPTPLFVRPRIPHEVMFVIGGWMAGGPTTYIESYDTKADRWIRWTMIAPMHSQRSDACATTHDGYVYITGGFSGDECLSSAERYDPTTDQWTAIASMRYKRSGVGCIGFRDFVYVIGGFNGTTRLFSAEKYNPETNTWTSLPNMYTPRSNFAVAIIDNLVFAIGGFNGESTSNLVECYDPATDQWCEATDMNEPRSALAACVIAGLPNVRDYVHQHRDNLMEEKRQKMLAILSQRSRQLNSDDDRVM